MKKPIRLSPKVEPIEGELLRFHVQSRSNPSRKYLVDLENFHFNGQCGCEHFAFNLGPRLSAGAPAGNRYRCAHIMEARDWLLDNKVLPQLRDIANADAVNKTKARIKR